MDNVVVGRLCQDPILRQPQRSGQPVARFTVAVNMWRRVGQEYVQRAPVFHRVVCFGPLAENVSNSLRKGMEVLAVGEWVDDSYSDEQGQRRVHVAMEAKAVGPALRKATALVSKAERKTGEPASNTAVAASASAGPARTGPAMGTVTPIGLAARAERSTVPTGTAGLGGNAAEPAATGGTVTSIGYTGSAKVRAGAVGGLAQDRAAAAAAVGAGGPAIGGVPPDPADAAVPAQGRHQLITDDGGSGDLTPGKAFTAGITESAGRRRSGMHRRREPEPESAVARGG